MRKPGRLRLASCACRHLLTQTPRSPAAAVNNYVADLVSADERTGAFGVLSGVAMAGTAFGFTAGGLAGDYISAVAPFEITFCLLVGSTLFTGLFLPYIAPAPRPDASVDGKPAARGGPLSCLAVFVPRRIEGHKGRYWGLTLLGLGAFMGVLATAFVVRPLRHFFLAIVRS